MQVCGGSTFERGKQDLGKSEQSKNVVRLCIIASHCNVNQ